MRGDLRIEMTEDEAERVMASLPGGKELCLELADAFLAELGKPL